MIFEINSISECKFIKYPTILAMLGTNQAVFEYQETKSADVQTGNIENVKSNKFIFFLNGKESLILGTNISNRFHKYYFIEVSL